MEMVFRVAGRLWRGAVGPAPGSCFGSTLTIEANGCQANWPASDLVVASPPIEFTAGRRPQQQDSRFVLPLELV